MLITANVVAVVAILAGLAGVWLTNRNQRKITRDLYVRDHMTEAYNLLMKGVYIRGVMLTEAATLPDVQQSTLKPIDLASDLEAQFGGALMTYGSPEVDELWLAFDERTEAMRAVLMDLRRRYGVPPVQIEHSRDGMPELMDEDARWRKAKEDLVKQVRAELLVTSGRPKSRALTFLRQTRA